MTNKEILEGVYKIARTHIDTAANESVHNHTAKLIAGFIEEEWQKQDDQELVDQYNRDRPVEDHITDASEIERHRGLEIDSEGTVTKII